MSTETLNLTFTRLSQLSQAYGSPAVDMAEKVIKHSAEGQILIGCGFTVATIIFLSASVAGAFWARYDDSFGAGSFFGVVIAVLAGVIGLGCAFGASVSLIDIWAWTALSDPQLALVHQIFGSMGGQ